MGHRRFSAVFTVGLLASCLVILGAVPMLCPAQSPSFTLPCTIETYGSAWAGNLTFGLFQYLPGAFNPLSSYLVVMSTSGELIYSQEYSNNLGTIYSGGYGIGVKYVSNDTIMYQGDPDQSTHFLNLDTNQTTDFPNVAGYHHDIDYDPVTGNFLVLDNYVRNVNGTAVLYDTIDELNSTGGVLWTWDTYDHIPFSWANPYNFTTQDNGETVVDFTHCNAIQWDYDENVVYLNSRHLDTFFKINMTSGDIIWACGLHGNFTLLNASGKTVSSLWYGSHDLEEIGPDVFMMFDNDFGNLTNQNDARSRMLEITLNETSMTAQETWSWEAPEEYYSSFWGEADILPNGDRLGTFGTMTKPYNSSIGAVIVEVNQTGQIVRTWTFPVNWGIYRVIPGTLVPTGLGIYPEIAQGEKTGGYNLVPVAIVAIVIVIPFTIFIVLIVRRRRRPQ